LRSSDNRKTSYHGWVASIAVAGECICDHKSEAGPTVTHVRGTLIASSLQTLKELGHFDRYREQVAREHYEAIAYAIAMSWLPVELAMAHYRACDALALSDVELARIGNSVSKRYADSFFGTMLRTSRKAGIEGPWLALRSQGRIWDRVYQGGEISIYRTGPKDAYSEQRGLPLAEIPYFRHAYLAWFSALGELLVRKLHLRLVRPREPHPHTIAFAGSWV
jgi:hypothetical protein